MLFALNMKGRFNYLSNKIAVLIVLVLVFSCQNKKQTDFSERTKIALRDVGNKLLLSSKDSTSLILPIIEVEPNSYQLTFSQPLYFEPDILVITTKESFKSLELLDYYRVEVLQCIDDEVAYSYQMSAELERTIIPCSGRFLPRSCYIINVKFIDGVEKQSHVLYSIVLIGLITIICFFYFNKVKSKIAIENREGKTKIGSFYFYPDQNKLVKEQVEITLSKKECELLEVFVANPNQIIKRDELTKRVWEDNGVFVGRSLDTYISKLRKKLKSDTSIKLTNVHGIGYKLEID